ncbi:tetratricopeptide repeat protein [Thalassospira mesophila]|uniref:tetratricopeptide repeat protein n=1 Tax=Thalassospira mesophila TaxID=1293891 RepID=UPI001302B73B|nr:surface lipoprotein assembly modifier [Thalassospira mesophila]
MFASIPLSGTARAQEPAALDAQQRANQMQQDFEELSGATEKSKFLLETDDGKGITFADILRDPDNIVLNFRWAKAQMAQGNIRGASATLERILILEPDLAPVRLYYAIIQYRLDSLDIAQAQFEKLRALPISDDVASQIDLYLDQIKKRRQRVKQSLSISFGGHYDTNRNSAPSDNERMVLGSLQEITNTGDRHQSDIGYMAAAHYDITYDLGYQAGHDVFAGVTGYYDDQVRLDNLDVGTASFEVGGHWRSPYVTITPTLIQTAAELNNEKFLTSRGARVRVDWKFQPDTTLWGQTSYFDERYGATPDSSALPLRSGQRYQGKAGVTYAWNNQNRTTFGLTMARKEAARSYYTYRSAGAELSHTLLLAGGKYILGSLSYGVDQYQQPDPLVTGSTPLTRKDYPLRARLSYGSNLANLLDAAWFGSGIGRDFYQFIAPVSWSITEEYQATSSNIANYDYDNWRTQILLSRRWAF